MTWNPLPDESSPSFVIEDAPAPLFRDPVFDGAADPSIMWNPELEEWWICYTQRRANVGTADKGWIHGSDIGIATSDDGGRSWLYRGTLELSIEPGHNTYWAPEIVHHDGTYHLFVSYITGIPSDWDRPRDIVHFTNDRLALEGWTFEGVCDLEHDRVIDPDVHRLDDGTWRMWYKHDQEAVTVTADSEDLTSWAPESEPTLEEPPHEAPIVFEWKEYYWLLADSWDGLSVWRSPDGDEWTRQEGRLLDDPGSRPGDDWQGGHPDAFVVDGDAYVLYHVHQSTDEPHAQLDDTGRARQTALQVAELGLEDGWLTCARDAYAE
ncbi:family 43 glycosylhydrolase [Halopiger xanaduensis]|uniref:Glycosyl hydrolase family 32 domain-containing protein n=1 Tax=Halopiger xanaduensis (strain DSM 18323 / JCM 14033 / SH-6) TaxID=797210 RepID=F8DDG6_HALXS|nr:family 43 glycosylhydrolase [Halopiger xanaduensis]AEH39060.1 glycosyl hydrolase family 32 domain-containing protein [Halopiger xanaduensis SH-6]